MLGPSMGLEKSGDLALEGGDVFRGFFFLRLGRAWFPLKCEYVKDGSGGFVACGQDGG